LDNNFQLQGLIGRNKMRRISSASQFFDNLLSRRRGTQSGVGSPREKFRRFGAAIASLALLATFCSVFAASTASAGTLATGDGMSFLATNGVTVPVGTAINYSVNSAADDYSYTGHGTVTFHAVSTTAVAPPVLPSGVTFNNGLLAGTPADGTVAHPTVGTYTFKIIGDDDNDVNSQSEGNGDEPVQTFTLTVTAAPLTITASSGTMVYGSTAPTITPIYTGLVNGDTSTAIKPTCSTTATSSSPVSGSPYTSSCSGASDPNYTITYVAGAVTVTAAPLTITASSGTMTFGGTPPTITPIYTGLVNGDKAPATPPTCSTTATSSSPISPPTYPSTCTGAVDSNYTITYVPGTVTVDPATGALVITASSGSMVYGSTPPTITPIITGNSASLTTQPTCTIVETSLMVSGSPYVTECSGAVDPSYTTITYVNGTLNVTPAPLLITASSGTMTVGGTVPTITPSFTGFVGGDTSASLTTQPTCTTTATSASTVAGSPYPTTCSGAVDPNYTITYAAGAVTVTPAPSVDVTYVPGAGTGTQVGPTQTTISGFVLGGFPAGWTAPSGDSFSGWALNCTTQTPDVAHVYKANSITCGCPTPLYTVGEAYTLTGNTTFVACYVTTPVTPPETPPSTTSAPAPTTTTTVPVTTTTIAPVVVATSPSSTSIPPAKVPTSAPSTGLGGSAKVAHNGALLSVGGSLILAGLLAMGFVIRRRRRA
jgi:hypothetical protein